MDSDFYRQLLLQTIVHFQVAIHFFSALLELWVVVVAGCKVQTKSPFTVRIAEPLEKYRGDKGLHRLKSTCLPRCFVKRFVNIALVRMNGFTYPNTRSCMQHCEASRAFEKIRMTHHRTNDSNSIGN